jgi:hypothetical protein
MHACAHCGESFTLNTRGRPKLFCSTRCSRAASRVAAKDAQTPPESPQASPAAPERPSPGKTLGDRRDELTAAMAKRLGGARDLASLRRDADSLPEPEVDRLLAYYGSPIRVG